MSKPFVSVVIPTHNRCYCIQDAVESVFNQSVNDFELIVVDDGSTDSTDSIVKQYGDRLILIKQKNRGASAARNKGIRAAKGEWVAFLDSDDMWEKDKLKIQITDIEKHPYIAAHIVDSGLQKENGEYLSLFELRGVKKEYELHPYRKRPLQDALKVNFYVQSCIIKKEVIETSGYFNENLKVTEDTDLMMRVALEGSFLVNTYLGVKIRRFSIKPDSLSLIYKIDKLQEMYNSAYIYLNIKRDHRLTTDERKIVCRSLGGIWCDIYSAQKDQRKWTVAFKALLNSLKDDPCLRSWARAFTKLTCADKIIPKNYTIYHRSK